MHHPGPVAGQHQSPREHERGVALILGVLFTIIVVGITVAGSLILKAHQTKTKTNFVSHGQAVQFARSGMIEALGWLRKQTAQPVMAFEPQLNAGATPPILDTIEPEIGIVREFEISETIWGRYEVWKRWDADPNATRLAWRQKMQCEDISQERGNLSAGSVWRIRSIGYVFRRNDENAAFNELPNQVLGQEVLEVETRRLALQPPGQAALCVDNASTCLVRTKGKVVGGTLAAGINYGSGTPSISGTGASVTGQPNHTVISPWDSSMTAVFGVALDELEAMADYVVTNANDFPSPIPTDTVCVAETSLTFDGSKPLRGTGVVIVVGDVTLSPGSYSAFSGLLYIQGNLTIREPTEVQGAVVVTGSVLLQGASDSVFVTYDDKILNHLRQELGTYRLASAVSRPMAQDH